MLSLGLSAMAASLRVSSRGGDLGPSWRGRSWDPGDSRAWPLGAGRDGRGGVGSGPAYCEGRERDEIGTGMGWGGCGC